MRPPQKNFALKLTTLIVVTACFVVIGASLLVSKNFRNILTLWGEDVQMTVYLSSDLSEQGRQDIEQYLKDSGQVSDVQLVSQEKALSDFRVQLASYAPDISKDEELLKLIPASLQVKLASNIPASEQSKVLQNLASGLKAKQGVDDVGYGQDWVEKYAAFVSAIEITLQVVGIVIVLASMFVMSNAIRASVQAHRDEIVVLEMIGATTSMIRKPFLKEGALLGVVSSTLAVGLCYGLYVGLKSLVVQRLSFLQLGEHLTFISPVSVVIVIIGGTAMGALGSYLCVRKINDGWAASQRA
ncbi:MAG: ABC transporter permease [Bdellovibrio sp.]|nr:ABC transporter permease [Bdellovibrio sp.]